MVIVQWAISATIFTWAEVLKQCSIGLECATQNAAHFSSGSYAWTLDKVQDEEPELKIQAFTKRH